MTDETLLKSVIDAMNNLDTGSMTYIFESYCKSKGIKKTDRRFKDRCNTYHIANSCYNWHKVECEIYGTEYVDNIIQPKLDVVLRKECGKYLIIATSYTNRCVEVQNDGEVLTYDPDGLRKLIATYPELFKAMHIGE